MLDAHIHITDSPAGNNLRHWLIAEIPVHTRLLCNTTTPSEWEAIRDYAHACPAIVPFFGIHPWFTADIPSDWQTQLEVFARSSLCSGIGEIGLDALHGAVLSRQQEIFEQQLALACRLKKPFVVHCVRAWGTLMRSLHIFARQGLPPFMVHGFGSSLQLLEELLLLGGYVSYRMKDIDMRPEKMRPLISATPANRLFLETDFPQCVYDTTKTVSAAYTETCERLYAGAAALKGTDPAVLADQLWNNGSVFTNPAFAGQREI
jgi:TatD DNase family protein